MENLEFCFFVALSNFLTDNLSCRYSYKAWPLVIFDYFGVSLGEVFGEALLLFEALFYYSVAKGFL